MSDTKHRAIWNGTTRPEDAADVLLRTYGELAGEEVLFLAFLAERQLKPDKAFFWLDVYGRLKSDHHCMT